MGSWQHAHPYLCAVGDRSRKELLTWADWATAREPFEAVQLLFPDTSGRWPDDPDYGGFPQPPLG